MKHILTFVILIFVSVSLQSQSTDTSILKKVLIEKYYIANDNDALDKQIYDTETVTLTYDTTYRIFIQLADGYLLKRIFGDSSHIFNITSTSRFFNNIDYGGQSFGYQIQKKDLVKKSKNTTTGIDTWLTLGLATSNNYGVLKSDDIDSSIFVKAGYLLNTNTAAGMPITQKDGINNSVPAIAGNITSFGITDSLGNDSTIFGSLKVGSSFKSDSFQIDCLGGISVPKNKILIAQLTTNGQLSFKLNIVVVKKGVYQTFVADTVAGDYKKNIKLNRFLTYPFPPPPRVCGCPDSRYKEYMPNRDCDSVALCKTLIVLGCKDPLACNYDPNVTDSVPSLCCYPGLCADRDISVVCPNLGVKKVATVETYPNPVTNSLNVNLSGFTTEKAILAIYNTYGYKVFEKNVSATVNLQEVDLSALAKGVYILQVTNAEGVHISKCFIKN